MKKTEIFYLAVFIPYIDCFGSCLLKPSFVSNWTEIVAQDTSLSEITISHCLGELPVRVDVQVKPLYPNGSADNFMFPGIGSAQRDDDVNEPYGGVVYIYNETTVTLMVPNKHDGTDKGRVIYTGDEIWTGPSRQKSIKGKVRVRVWSQSDFPAPDYQSNWTRVTSGRVNESILEFPHHLGTVPGYASIQLRSSDLGSVSDGIGCGLGFDRPIKSNSWGGVLYGYDDKKIRILLPSHSTGSLFSATDGWGVTGRQWNKGDIRVKAWKMLSKVEKSSTLAVEMDTTNEELQTKFPNNVTLNTQDDIFEIMVIPQNGSNKGMHFKGSGAAQNIGQNQHGYGGLIYSFSEHKYRMYHPPFPVTKRTSGFLLDISTNWGNETYQQKTNYVKIRVQIWKPSCVSSNTTSSNETITDGGKCIPGSKTVQSKATSNRHDDGGLSPGAGAGIGIGVAVAVLGSLACLIWTLLKKKEKKNSVGDKKDKEGENKEEIERSTSEETDDSEEHGERKENDDTA